MWGAIQFLWCDLSSLLKIISIFHHSLSFIIIYHISYISSSLILIYHHLLSCLLQMDSGWHHFLGVLLGSPGISICLRFAWLEAGIWRIYWAQRRCSGPDCFNIRDVGWPKSPKRRTLIFIRPWIKGGDFMGFIASPNSWIFRGRLWMGRIIMRFWAAKSCNSKRLSRSCATSFSCEYRYEVYKI